MFKAALFSRVGTGNVVSVTKEVNFKFHLILIDLDFRSRLGLGLDPATQSAPQASSRLSEMQNFSCT